MITVWIGTKPSSRYGGQRVRADIRRQLTLCSASGRAWAGPELTIRDTLRSSGVDESHSRRVLDLRDATYLLLDLGKLLPEPRNTLRKDCGAVTIGSIELGQVSGH